VGKERARVVGGHAYTPRRTRIWEGVVRATARSEWGWWKPPAKGPVEIVVNVWRKVPLSVKGEARQAMLGDVPCTVGADVDNLAKAILDALQGAIFENDRQVWCLTVVRKWGEQDSIQVFIKAEDSDGRQDGRGGGKPSPGRAGADPEGHAGATGSVRGGAPGGDGVS
jgi:Holliday junction resolvase RusA-like endonuclease